MSSTPIRLYILQYTLVEDGTPVPGYLIQTSEGKNILVDTGYPRDDAFRAQKRPQGRDFQIMSSAIEQITPLGLTPQDIDVLVCTHFDPDHAGGHDDFPWSELVVQRAHYEFAQATDNDRFTQTRAHWDHPNLRYRLIEGDIELVPGVRLIETDGHVPGHQAVLVQLPHTGPVLLAIDAAAMAEDIDPATRMRENGVDLDPEAAWQSAEKLHAIVKSEEIALTVFGHDENLWPTLKKAPHYYD